MRTFHTLWRRSTGGVSTNLICPNCLGGCYKTGAAKNIIPVSPKSARATVESQATLPPSSEVYRSVDQFLNSLPRDYYTVMQVKPLKNKLKKKDNLVLVDVREPSE